jgi:excisionase family DNA binding protein
MINLYRIPVKTAVRTRRSPLLLQNQRVQEHREAMTIDPLLSLAEAQTLLGNPCHSTLLRWIRSGTLRAMRPHKTGHYKIKMSEVERFRSQCVGEQVTE